MNAQPELSVIMPVYNEAVVLAKTVGEIECYLTTAQLTYELIMVDDGSTDRTAALAQELAQANHSIRVLRGPHQGKGAAVKEGVAASTGTWLVFLDADHATRIEEWERCAPWLRDGCAVVIGSRKMPGACVMVHQPPLREAMGKVFTWLTNAMLGVRLTDITCGFKCFEGGAARAIFSLQRIQGWAFDAEILFIARRLGYRIQEVPVAWRDDSRTKVRLFKDALRSFAELAAIRLGALRGWYPRNFASRTF